MGGDRGGVRSHGAEFDQCKRFLVAPYTLLTEDGGTCLQPADEADCERDWPKQQQAFSGKNKV